MTFAGKACLQNMHCDAISNRPSKILRNDADSLQQSGDVIEETIHIPTAVQACICSYTGHEQLLFRKAAVQCQALFCCRKHIHA